MSELLDAVLPEYQFSELHRLSVDASPETALAAMRDVSVADMPRRAFSRYWLLIRPGKGIIRRLWLTAAKRRAEASS